MKLIQILFYGIVILAANRAYCLDSLMLVSRDVGFFSVFMDVVNILESYDAGLIKGVQVDFKKTGLYYDPLIGENWWEYYFDPICLGEISNPRITSGLGEYQVFHKEPLHDHFNVIQKYIHPKGYIQSYIENFISQNFTGYYVIGVHYRGTDKRMEAGRVSHEKMLEVIDNTIKDAPENWKIFVATDEQQFLQKLIDNHLDRVCYINACRSIDDSTPVHYDKTKSPSKVGEEALIDCLLLSKSDILIRTASNLSECCKYFNPLQNIVFVSKN